MNREEYLAFQDAFKVSVLNGQDSDILTSSLLVSKGVPAGQRLKIHYNNFRETLSESLLGIFPALIAFVGPAFVKGALKEFCVKYPPAQASLLGYGGAFAQFLSEHTASEKMPYIVDIAKLEWTLYSLQQVNEQVYDNGKNITLSENVRLIDSAYPLMSLWSVAVGQLPPEAVHIDQGGQMVAALLRRGEISLIALDKAEANFLRGHLSETQDAILEVNDNNEALIERLTNKNIIVMTL